jgi:hypothetical protein
VTIHPSFLLRIRDAIDKEREFPHFVADLRRARESLNPAAGGEEHQRSGYARQP